MTSSIHEFEIVVEGLPADVDDDAFDSIAAELHERGIDDATLAESGGVTRLVFARESASFTLAVLDALRQICEAPIGLTPVRVEREDLVTGAEIAKRLGLSPETVRLHAAGKRRGGGFPSAVVDVPVRQWSWPQVAAWYGKDVDPKPAQTVEMLNGWLALRRSEDRGILQPRTVPSIEVLRERITSTG